MLQNYLKIAFRNLRRERGFAFINIAGLAVGIACCLLILLYVRDELSYDRFHKNAGRIYRVVVGEDQVVTPTVVAPLFKRTFPEVEEAVRLYDVGSFRPTVVRHEQNMFQERRFFYADSTVFDVFTLPFLAGRPEAALTRPNTIVLTRSAAQRYFGAEDPLGQTLYVGGDAAYEVTGVIEDVPPNTHLSFDFLASFSTLGWSTQEIWNSANFYTYLLLRSEAAAAPLAQKIPDLLGRIRQETGALPDSYTLRLQPLTRIHLYADGRIRYVYLFSAIGLLVLLIACINYMNLSTARAARRAREVGIRKAAGATRGQLARQFYGESALLAGLALGFALLLVELLLPAFSAMSGKSLSTRYLEEPLLLLILLGIGAAVSVVAGSYPALLLSSFQPARVLKGQAGTDASGASFRKGLVIFQFAASVFLIAGTAVVYSQLDYVRHADLGFDQEQVVVLPIGDRQLRETYTTLKQEILQYTHVLHAAAVNSIPGHQRGGYALEAEGLQVPEGEFFPIRGVPADKDVVETLGLELIAGEGFPRSEAYTTEQGYVYLINEAAARSLNWQPDEAVGKWFNLLGDRMGTVVGVVKDFHYASLHEPIEPLALFIEPGSYEYLLVKVAPGDLPGTLGALEQTWARLAPHRPFDYEFLDREFGALYHYEQRVGRFLSACAGLALFIACLGLFGLAAFTATQRTKEIGIRKVLGASAPSIAALLSKDFLGLVCVAFLLGAPLAYVAGQRWLEAFAYRTEIGPGLFLLAGLLALLIALLTVSYQAVKAALLNPVKALRYE